MNTTKAQLRHRRNYLFEKQGGLCCYCLIPMLHWDEPGHRNHNGSLRHNSATLEHKYNRAHPKRQHPTDGEERYVIACNHCNNKKGKQDLHVLTRGGQYANDWTIKTGG